MGKLALLKRISLRTKIVVPMLALSVLPATAAGLLIMSRMRASMREDAVRRVVFDTGARARSMEEFVHGIRQDLRFLSQLQLLRDLGDATARGDTERVGELRAVVERELLLFSQGKRAFYQVRYLDADGKEVVRLNVEGGRARAVPAEQLQDKSRRYYVVETAKRGPGELYMSPVDLNMERGRVEKPYRPVIRFGAALHGDSGERTGILVLNVDARHVFDLARPLPEGAEAYLVDERGRYLGYVGPSEGLRESFGLAQKRSLGDELGVAAKDVMDSSEPEMHFENDSHLVSIGAVALAPEDSAPRWRLIVTTARGRIGAATRQLTITLSVMLAGVVALVALIGMLVAHHLARPVIELRRAMSRIATERGASGRFAAPGPADEIEGLALEFHAMAERLGMAQARLQGLQSGLAKADKLSSIGQLTTGVIEEIQAPLSALKNKLQAVGQESGSLPKGQVLAAELLQDTRHMEETLASFSRLAQLSGAEPEVTSLSGVVRSVSTLVGPELRRRGLELSVTSDPGVPAVRGDITQLRQLVVNLLLNAADAEPESRRIEVRIASLLSDERDNPQPVGATLKVTDDGRGIPTDCLVRIWDPFYTTKQEGAGLGLAICRRIVEEHGGRIEVSSQVGHGTTVAVELPQADPDVDGGVLQGAGSRTAE